MPSTIPQALLSPAELAYLHSSLSAQPQPIRPDLRSPTQFRPSTAETDVLPGANGSARVCYADGGEAIVGVKAEVVKREGRGDFRGDVDGQGVKREGMDVDAHSDDDEGDDTRDPTLRAASRKNRRSRRANGTHQHIDASARQPRLSISIDIPNHRDDDPLPSLLTSILSESVLAYSSASSNTTASTSLSSRLSINDNHHFHLHIDILLFSPPQSYPLPLLSLTLHLALLSTRLPRNTATDPEEDDPVWDDDWEAAVPLYGDPFEHVQQSDTRGPPSRPANNSTPSISKPPITLLAMTCGSNILFDPSTPELAVADSVLAISLAVPPTDPNTKPHDENAEPTEPLHLLSLRTIPPPSRQTPLPPSGSSDILAEGSTSLQGDASADGNAGNPEVERESAPSGTWIPKRGGVGRSVLRRAVDMSVRVDGVGWEVVRGVAGFGG